MKTIRILVLFGAVIFFSSCATFPQESAPAQNSNLTVGMVKTKIIKGETTQAEILQVFGAPNIITKNRNNNEVWNYNRMSFTSVTGTDSAMIIFWGGSRAMTAATTKSFDLI